MNETLKKINFSNTSSSLPRRAEMVSDYRILARGETVRIHVTEEQVQVQRCPVRLTRRGNFHGYLTVTAARAGANGHLRRTGLRVVEIPEVHLI